MERIDCKVSSISYSNRDTGFYIFKAIDGEDKEFVAKGEFQNISVNVGLRFILHGSWKTHDKYGNQFNIVTHEMIPDKGKTGVISYLVAHVKTIGIITANKLYEAFGDDLCRVLDEETEKILALSFLTRQQAQSILDEWSSVSESRTISIILSDLGLTQYQIKAILSHFGLKNVKNSIKSNPYCICEVDGIGFPTADKVARKLNIGIDDDRRIDAIILFGISSLCSNDGHVYVLINQLKEYISKKLFLKNSIEPFSYGSYINDTHLLTSLKRLSVAEKIFIHNDKVYLRHSWYCEYNSADYLSKMVISDLKFSEIDFESVLQSFEKVKGFSLSPEQRDAFFSLKHSNVVVISGYPGTGKTTLTSAFVHLFENANIDYVLMSPTGIAAKRLSQVTGRPAYTIHRALGFKGSHWEFNATSKYAVGAVLLDESSMVDSDTFYRLVSSLLPNTVFIMVGDPEQLPSVGSGYVLKSLMSNSDVSHTSLTKIYRQDAVSDIVKVAHNILNNKVIDTSFRNDSEFLFLSMEQSDVLDEIKKVTKALKDKDRTFQVLSPVYDGILGVNSLNDSLREVLNPDYLSSNFLKVGDSNLYVGDRVMIVKNDYEKMVFNGDVGKVHNIDYKNRCVDVKVFDWSDPDSSVPKYVEKVFSYSFDKIKISLKVAYACSVHRYQGREIDYVILPMSMDYNIMLYKNLVYTAITRARKKVFLFGSLKAFRVAVMNNRESKRNSMLSELVSELIPANKASFVHNS